MDSVESITSLDSNLPRLVETLSFLESLSRSYSFTRRLSLSLSLLTKEFVLFFILKLIYNLLYNLVTDYISKYVVIFLLSPAAGRLAELIKFDTLIRTGVLLDVEEPST